jgi:dihydrofolate reductase
MRKLVYAVAMSLDGYIAGPQGEYDWIVMDPDVDLGALLGRFDVALVGRRTFEEARGRGGIAMPGLAVYVFSRTLSPDDCPGATLSSDPAGTVEALRRQEGKDLWLFGGGSLFRSFLDLGLVDAVEVAVIPVLLGGGIPMVAPPAASARLRLTGHTLYPKTGTLRLAYDVERP